MGAIWTSARRVWNKRAEDDKECRIVQKRVARRKQKGGVKSMYESKPAVSHTPHVSPQFMTDHDEHRTEDPPGLSWLSIARSVLLRHC